MINADARDAEGGDLPRIFGHLTLLCPTGELIRGVKVYECQCDCGKRDKATIPLLMMGRKTSCGCQNKSKLEVLKPDHCELDRLNALVLEDGREIREVAFAAGLPESQVIDALGGKKKLTVATAGLLLKTLGKHWSDLDEPTERTSARGHSEALSVLEEAQTASMIVAEATRSPLPHRESFVPPNGKRPRHLAAILTRNRHEPPRWPTEGRTLMAPLADSEGLAFGADLP